jgi:hypothetical protein
MGYNNKEMYDKSVNEIEPAVINAINKRFAGKVEAYKPEDIDPRTGKNNEDYLRHRDVAIKILETGKTKYYDVKIQTPGRTRNFSIADTLRDIDTIDGFIFVIGNIAYVCNYNDVIKNLTAKLYYNQNYSLISVYKIQKIVKYKFEI